MITFDLLHRAMMGDKPSVDEIRHRIDMAIDTFLYGFGRTEAPFPDPQTPPGRDALR